MKNLNITTDYDLYLMKLHDRIILSDFYITRVPGGWIYEPHNGAAVFVPFSKEFAVKPEKVKEDKETAVEVLRHLSNERIKIGVGKSPLKETPDTIRMISKLLGTNKRNDIVMVINYKVDEWKNTDMAKYLRPSTLFRPSNFVKYKIELEAKSEVSTNGNGLESWN